MAGPGAEPEPPAAATAMAAPPNGAPELVEEDLLLEEISIDGMCGVY